MEILAADWFLPVDELSLLGLHIALYYFPFPQYEILTFRDFQKFEPMADELRRLSILPIKRTLKYLSFFFTELVHNKMGVSDFQFLQIRRSICRN